METATGRAVAVGEVKEEKVGDGIDEIRPPLPPLTLATPAPAEERIALGLSVGSADPHLLCHDDSKASQPRRRPTASLLSHIAADDGEVRVRPMATTNEPPVTEAVGPPPSQPSGAPVVTDVSQVIPRRTLRLIKRWRRRNDESLAAARAGDRHRAMRLKPKDLWLDHERNSVPETRAWDWDLRPLAHGMPATPLPTSGRNGLPPDTDLDLAAVRAGGVGFADQAIVCEMLNGVTDDSSCRRGTLLCAPHSSALEHAVIAAGKARASVEKGWATSSVELPCWPLRASPYGIVDESERAGRPKYRLTTDLSWPPPGTLRSGDGGYVDSVNGAMERDDWPANRLPRVSEMAEAAAVLQTSGVAVAGWSVDCEAFYRVHGRQRREVWRNAMVLEGEILLDQRCCFGSAADASKCCRVSNYLVHHARRAIKEVDERYPPRDPAAVSWLEARREAAVAAGAAADDERYAACGFFSMYVDDGGGWSLNDELFDERGTTVGKTRAWAHLEAVEAVLLRFGHQSSSTKRQAPAAKLELLGVEFDLEKRRVRLSVDKQKSYAARVEKAAAQRVMPRSEWQQLLGRLTFAAGLFPRARVWNAPLWRLARAQFRLSGDKIGVTKRARAALLEWSRLLRADDHEGVPLASRPSLPPASECGNVYADASGEVGWGAWATRGDELLVTYGTWSEEERGMIIAELELFASTLGLVTLGPELGGSDVWEWTDNQVCLAAMRSLVPRTPRMQEMVDRRVEWMRVGGMSTAAERVSSKNNLWADMLSRGEAAAVAEQAAALGLRWRRIEPPAPWRSTTELLRLPPQ